MSSNYVDCDFLFKLLLVGDTGVGKSCLLLRYSDNVYSDNYISTIGVDFKIRTIDIEGKRVKLQMWDTAGQERFRNIVTSYYRSADAVILAFDTTDLNSFHNVLTWKSEVDRCSRQGAVQMLVGTKADATWERAVSYEQAKQLADAHSMAFVETSAKNDTNVSSTFATLASLAKERVEREATTAPPSSTGKGGSLSDSLFLGSNRRTSLAAEEKEVNCCSVS